MGIIWLLPKAHFLLKPAQLFPLRLYNSTKVMFLYWHNLAKAMFSKKINSSFLQVLFCFVFWLKELAKFL